MVITIIIIIIINVLGGEVGGQEGIPRRDLQTDSRCWGWIRDDRSQLLHFTVGKLRPNRWPSLGLVTRGTEELQRGDLCRRLRLEPVSPAKSFQKLQGHKNAFWLEASKWAPPILLRVRPPSHYWTLCCQAGEYESLSL